MIVYQATKARFLGDSVNSDIEDVIATRYLASTGRYAPQAEFNSWKESLGQMAKVLRDDEMPAHGFVPNHRYLYITTETMEQCPPWPQKPPLNPSFTSYCAA